MKRVLIVVILLALIINCTLLVLFFNSNYYYANRLIDAIEEEDILKIQSTIAKKPECINTYPSFSPKWWQSAMDTRVLYPLALACKIDNIDIVKILVENGADINSNCGVTALSVTYTEKKANWYEISVYLIENGANVNYTTEYSSKYFCVLEDICTKRYGGDDESNVYSALDYALSCIDVKNVNWVRALQYGIYNNRISFVKLLLEQKYCNINDTTETGMTPLMFAAINNDENMVILLLSYGASKSARDNQGKTALDYARNSGNQELIQLLS